MTILNYFDFRPINNYVKFTVNVVSRAPKKSAVNPDMVFIVLFSKLLFEKSEDCILGYF